jgi:hypothetical protein
MSDLVERLRATQLDKDNFPRMDSERWLPVGLAGEAADEIERLRTENERLKISFEALSVSFDGLDRALKDEP